MNKIKPKFIRYINFLRVALMMLFCSPKDRNVFNLLKEKIASIYLRRYVDKYFKKIENEENKYIIHNNEKIIWVYWMQGMDDAPVVVKKCVNSIICAAKKENFKVNILNCNAAKNMVDIPE